MLFDILSEIVQIDDVLLIVKSNGAVSEVKSNSLGIRQKEKWITIGSNDGPAHMHINSEQIKSASFVREEKPERTSYSIRFYDECENRVLAAFFTKMYDKPGIVNPEREKRYENLSKKFGQKIKF